MSSNAVGDGSTCEGCAVTLHSSWKGLIAAASGAAVVLVAGGSGVIIGGWRVLSTGILLAGVIFVLTVLADYPVASTFSAEGITRRMPLRRQHIAWERVTQLTRARPGVTRNLRGLTHGGLTAVVGRRRYLLVDQPESPEEFDQLVSVVGEHAERLGLYARMRTADGTHPTWLYRRAKWAPVDAERR